MKRRSRILIVAALIGTAVLGGTAFAQKPRPSQVFMHQKLLYASSILQGLTLEKFDLVVTNATGLRSMAMTNAYVKLGNPAYRQQIENFQQRVDTLSEIAKQHNLEGATAAYSKVIESCVACHQVFRREQFVLHGAPPEPKK